MFKACHCFRPNLIFCDLFETDPLKKLPQTTLGSLRSECSFYRKRNSIMRFIILKVKDGIDGRREYLARQNERIMLKSSKLGEMMRTI